MFVIGNCYQIVYQLQLIPWLTWQCILGGKYANMLDIPGTLV